MTILNELKSALKVLGLDKIYANKDYDYNLETVETAYKKMLRRFPPQTFPEKAISIKNAYNALSLNDEYWESILETDEICFSTFFPYLELESLAADLKKLP